MHRLLIAAVAFIGNIFIRSQEGDDSDNAFFIGAGKPCLGVVS